MKKILGADGGPVRGYKRDLTREVGRPTLTGVRQTRRGERIAENLTPARLAALLRSADDGSEQGSLRDYLTLAEEMEERDPHYAAVLGVRKRAVSGLEPAVEEAGESEFDRRAAEAVRELAHSPEFPALIEDCLDALGKGFSATEIVWDRTAAMWTPKQYEWRDPRFFVFDRVTGRELRLLDEADAISGVALAPYKWIVHLPGLKSGLPARGGLARLVAAAYMVKAYAITDWTAFAEVFGMPLRLGRYGPNATESDIEMLAHAVTNLGTDAAAVIPDSMRIEFEDAGSQTGGAGLFERLAVYLDKQVSKAVLGQTMTADDGASRSQAEVHDAVRGDILRADTRQLENTLNRDLVRPFIDLNYGPQEKYPRLKLPIPESEDVKSLVDGLAKMIPLGLRVGASGLRGKMGLPDPEPDDELLGGPAPVEARIGASTAANRARNRTDDIDEIDRLAEEAAKDWERQLTPPVKDVQAAAVAANSYDAALAAIDKLSDDPDDAAVDGVAGATLIARGIGEAAE